VVSRDDYAWVLPVPTRWADNDAYGHVNNVQYYAFFDTAINAWLIAEGGLDVQQGEVIGVCAESSCRYKAAITYPEVADVALRVAHVGRTSVRYELAVFPEGVTEAAAVGTFVHVFVDRGTRRPTEPPPRLRDALERLRVDRPDQGSRTTSGAG
jgi:acyl-CoA thioester hydrolase